MQWQPDELAVAGLDQRTLDGVEKGGVGLGIVERAAFFIERRDALFRDEKPQRPVADIELRGDPGADLAALVGRGPHQGDLRIVAVEEAVAVPLGDGLRRAEIDHVESSGRDDAGDAGARDGAEAILGRGQDAAAEQVAYLGRGDVENSGQQAAVGELLHAAPAGSGGVEHHAVVIVAQHANGLRHAGGGHAEHGQAERRAGGGAGRGGGCHSGDGPRRVVEDHAAEPVEPGHVRDRGHHHDVRDVDVGRDVARGQGRDHDLGQAERQGAHSGRGDGRSAAAADGDDGGDVVALRDEAGEGGAHRGDGLAAVARFGHGDGAVGMVRGDLQGGDVDTGAGGAGADVDAADRPARRHDGV